MKILYLPPIPYSGLKQRPQYLAEELAREHEILYLDPTVSLMKFLLKGGEWPKGYFYEVSGNLHVARLSGMLSAHRSLEALWGGIGFPERVQLRKYLRAADALWIGCAPWYGLVQGFRGPVIYDKMDEDRLLTRNGLLRRLIMRTEPRLIARADLIFVTAERFREQMAGCGKTAVLVPNAVDREQAFAHPTPVRTGLEGARVFGYVGLVSHWFDMEAIRVVLQADPRNHVLLVGPAEIRLPLHERLHAVGRVPKRQVGSWVEAFDVCLYPFRRTELLDTIDPVKIYEYLAANKPVLAVRSAETKKFGARVVTYGSESELAELLRGAPFPAPFVREAERREFVLENDWQSRGAVIRRELENGFVQG